MQCMTDLNGINVKFTTELILKKLNVMKPNNMRPNSLWIKKKSK